MSESKFWSYINNNIGHVGHFSRVESHDTSAGIPDVDYCIRGYKNNLELKYWGISEPKLKPVQSAWFRRRVKHGGNPWLLLLDDTGKDKRFILIKGEDVAGLIQMPVRKWESKAHLKWYGKINWDELIKELMG